MDTRVTIVLGIASLVVIGLTIWPSKRQPRTDALREHHDPANDRARQDQSDPQRAERGLQERKLHVEQLRIRALSPDERDGLAERWRSVQDQFADDSAGATRAADALVAAVMQRRGYPVGDFEGRAADVTVDRPRVVEHVRAARAIARRNARHDDHGDASAEDRRQAFVDYRALFDDLLVDDSLELETPPPPKTRR
jgi:hypothetical protein